MEPRGDLHLPLAIDIVAVGVEIGAVGRQEVESVLEGRVSAGNGVRAVRFSRLNASAKTSKR